MDKSILEALALFVENKYIKKESLGRVPHVLYSLRPCLDEKTKESVTQNNTLQATNINAWIGSAIQPSFNEVLFQYIDSKRIAKDSEVYKKAGVDRKTFSKIRSSKNYKPGKSTVIALALALELNEKDTENLLEAAGYALTYNQKFDLTVRFCIKNKIYNLIQVNELLDYMGQRVLQCSS